MSSCVVLVKENVLSCMLDTAHPNIYFKTFKLQTPFKPLIILSTENAPFNPFAFPNIILSCYTHLYVTLTPSHHLYSFLVIEQDIIIPSVNTRVIIKPPGWLRITSLPSLQ